MKLEKTSDDTWIVAHAGNDFYISKDMGEYIIDIFDINIENSAKAYIETITCENMKEVKNEIKNYTK